MTKTKEQWQWRHGNFQSDLMDTEEEALKWATRATTGGCDDDIAVRRVQVDTWRQVGIGGYEEE